MHDENDGNRLTGEWWNRDPMQVLRQSMITGAAPNVSDAYTINGQPGDLYGCSNKGFDQSLSPIILCRDLFQRYKISYFILV